MSTDHHSHGTTANGRPIHDSVAFEPRDVSTSPILKFLFYLGIVIVLSYVMVYGIYKGLGYFWVSSHEAPMPSRATMDPSVMMPPEPRLQEMPGHMIDPQEDYRLKLKADIDANNKLEWIDRQAGVAQIPVKDAMQLIVDKGFPAIKAPEDSK